MAKRNKSRDIGIVGEKIALDYLQRHGYEVIKFGKAMGDENKHLPIPLLPDFSVGHSHGLFHPYYHSVMIDRGWKSPNLPEWSDIPYEEIKRLALRCREDSKCLMRDEAGDNAPCANTNLLLDKMYLSEIRPMIGNMHNPYPGISQGDVTGYMLVHICLDKIITVMVEEYLKKREIMHQGAFNVINTLVGLYIENYWGSHVQKNKKLRDSGASIFPGSGSHPGRYDFAAFKDGVVSAIEVKTNSAITNYWQSIRLGLMSRLGCECYILNVLVASDDIDPSKNWYVEDCEYIDLKQFVVDDGVLLPTESDFIDMIKWRRKSKEIDMLEEMGCTRYS